ncbi:MAG TPA: hypothetical protein VFQ53_16295 [Kofleriaceae bacterium]|nr:hypothetical protein [Kofleriaceae bacterium]
MLLRPASLAIASALALGAPSVALADTAPVATHVVKAEAPAPATQQASNDYAQREAQDKQVANYEGGNTVVIAMSGGALVVLLLILLLL